MDAPAISRYLSQLDRELWIITAAHAGQRSGLVATFVQRASIVPECPRLLIGLANTHYTCELIEQSRVFAAHLIAARQLEHVWRFGTARGRDADKFEGLELREGQTGAPLLADALMCLECRVETQMSTGDRIVYLAEVVEGIIQGAESPLTTGGMIVEASPEHLQLLRAQMERDATRDAEAIAQWRASK
ncbi:MAG TPA: flavin reductase family protein [Planctomycetaceae bacterium]|nr:flavin reductase family protein [Planctomycetaceae bacterium]